MTEKGLNALRKIAAEFPNMSTPPGGWGPPGVREDAPVVKPKPARRRPPKAVAKRPSANKDDLNAIHKRIDNDPNIPAENKEAEKNAATEQWNHRNF